MVNFILACLGVLFSILAILYPPKFKGHILFVIWVYIILLSTFSSIFISNIILPSRIYGIAFSYLFAIIITGLGIWGNFMSDTNSL